MSAPRVPPAAVARDRLRIAVQRSGRLAGSARALLAACGLVWREAEDQLFWPGREQPVDLLRVRDDDIPGLIAAGHCDLGIVGRNVLLERQGGAPRPPAAREWRALG
ncbi:MAG: ATP phosphoribosyltransferase, partial [Thermoanaerobaculia bacterium]